MDKEKQYITGFNNGYILAKHEPALLSKIVKDISPKTDYVEGLFSGKEEYEIERSRLHENELSQLRNRSQNRDRNLERE